MKSKSRKSPPKPSSRLAWAAKTAIARPKNSEFVRWLGAGPSIRARARLALAAAFMVAAPTLFLGVLRTDGVAQYTSNLSVYDAFLNQITHTRIAIENTRASLWRLDAQPELENERKLSKSLSRLDAAVTKLIKDKPKDFDYNPQVHLTDVTRRINESVEHALLRRRGLEKGSAQRALTLAQLAIATLSNDVTDLHKLVASIDSQRRELTMMALSRIGRDQLILFLVLLFAIPIFVGFVPGWLVTPLTRLKGIGQRIEGGRVRELAISGNDEVSQVARAIKTALIWREELDHKKSAKIFEIRNVLRAVLCGLKESVLVIDKDNKINYANQSAGILVGKEPHQIEGTVLEDCLFAPQLTKAIDKAKQGDVEEKPFKVNIELADGRVQDVSVRLSTVHDRDGEVSRVVAVLVPEVQNDG